VGGARESDGSVSAEAAATWASEAASPAEASPDGSLGLSECAPPPLGETAWVPPPVPTGWAAETDTSNPTWIRLEALLGARSRRRPLEPPYRPHLRGPPTAHCPGARRFEPSVESDSQASWKSSSSSIWILNVRGAPPCCLRPAQCSCHWLAWNPCCLSPAHFCYHQLGLHQASGGLRRSSRSPKRRARRRRPAQYASRLCHRRVRTSPRCSAGHVDSRTPRHDK